MKTNTKKHGHFCNPMLATLSLAICSLAVGNVSAQEAADAERAAREGGIA